MTSKVFILTGKWFDYKNRNILRFIGRSSEDTPVEIVITKNYPVCFVERINKNNLQLNYLHKRKPVNLKNFNGEEVDALYFNTQSDLISSAAEIEKQNIKTFESDINPVRRYLMERFINVQVEVIGNPEVKGNLVRFINPAIKPCNFKPDFRIASIDIETGVKTNSLYSIAVHLTSYKINKKIVFIVGNETESKPEYISIYKNEKVLLLSFIKWFQQADPDIIIGWHVIGFDLMFLESKCKALKIPFNIARANGKVVLKSRRNNGYFADITGRIVIDGPPTLRSSFFTFEDYKLETVAQEVLGEGKTITPDQNKIEEIERLFAEDKVSLAEYNLQDAVLVTEIFRKTGLIELNIRRAQLSGLLLDQLGMMTHAFDHFFLPRLHREDYVAPNVKDLVTTEHAAGGYVIEPKPGIYDDVIVLDFKSLYPSIIMTFKIDPLSRLLNHINPIKTPKGYKFSSTKHFLPDFIQTLMEQRALAKKKNDKQLSQAIKILMNSFYGVMGSYGCRFYHPHLPTAITGTGQFLLLGSKDYLEDQGYKVVYGDTDSLFVKLKDGEGNKADFSSEKIAASLNKYWKEKLKKDYKVDSYLEIEYEKYYRKLVITPARGSESGAKKRYAGLLIKGGKENLEFVGMEFVRSDWTRMAKEFQVELYRRIFNEEKITDWLINFVKKINNGEFDDKLIYKKRLRKSADEYVKNVPPHVRAARMIGQKGGSVYYIITNRGPVPIDLPHNDIDYNHYIEKQIKPIADSLLVLLNKSFDEIVKKDQLSFF